MKNDYNLTNGLVLDVGCGKGQRALEFAKKGNKVIAVDKDEKAILDLSDAHENLTALHFDIKEMTIDRDKYDLILANNLLPFLGDKDTVRTVLTRLWYGLKKGGFLEFTLFGKDDAWVGKPGMYFYESADEVNQFPEHIYWQSEEKGYAPTMKGDTKFWHIFRFIVRK